MPEYEISTWQRIGENLIVLLGLAPLMVAAWWALVRLVNKSMGFRPKEVYQKIYSDPLAGAIMRLGVLGILAWIVISAFQRPI